ncbi:MAG: CPBP family intramembrane metalloprotease [Lachnospiraceae bacterium]|nr:CPBP family intramembrane metalloprotease [Lachnospiraceae bacterium]
MEEMKKTWEENEAPVIRWIFTIVLSLAIGVVLGAVFSFAVNRLPFLQDGQFLAPERALLSGIASFATVYLLFWFFLKVLCKTSMRAFFFGRDRKADLRSMFWTGVLYLIGLTLGQLLSSENTFYDNQPVSIMIINTIFCLCFLWLQTSTEEIFFRGIFLRIPFKDKVPSVLKGLIAAVISSLLFMGAHLANPEVTTRSGLTVVLMASTYFLTGFMMFLSNLLLGGMEPGLIIHFCNNFFCFVFVRAEVTALLTPAMFVDRTKSGVGVRELIMLLIAYTPPTIWLVIRYRKQRAESNRGSNR